MTKPLNPDRPLLKTSAEVIAALRLRYPANAYAFLEQVANATGLQANRHCDVLVMSLWPSRGLEIIGIEVKNYRGDWQRELENPAKADQMAVWCDRWFIAVGDERIVEAGELPATWGLLVPGKNGTLRTRVEAARLTEPSKLGAPGRLFIAAVLRACCGQLTDAARLIGEYNRGKTDGAKAERENYANNSHHYLSQLTALKKQVQEFEAASGVSILRGWQHGKIGDAVKRILDGEGDRIQERLKQLHTTAAGITDAIAAEMKKLK